MKFNSKEQILLKQYMPSKADMKKFTSFFYAFSDDTRLKIVFLLMIKPLCVSDIVAVLNINQTTISHQLKILKSLELVSYDRVGKNIIYYIKNSNIENVFNETVACI